MGRALVLTGGMNAPSRLGHDHDVCRTGGRAAGEEHIYAPDPGATDDDRRCGGGGIERADVDPIEGSAVVPNRVEGAVEVSHGVSPSEQRRHAVRPGEEKPLARTGMGIYKRIGVEINRVGVTSRQSRLKHE